MRGTMVAALLACTCLGVAARLEAVTTDTSADFQQIPAPPLESEDFWAHVNYGRQLGIAFRNAEGQERKRLATEAAQHFRRAAEIDATSADAWLGLASMCLPADCEPKEVALAAQNALGQKPGDLLGTYLLADAWIEMGRYDEARGLLLPLVETEGPLRDDVRIAHARARLGSAEALIQAGKTEEALKLLDAGPLPEGEARMIVAGWISEMKDYAKWLSKGLSKPDPCVGDLLGASKASQAGQVEKARKMYQDVIAHCPDQEIVKMARTELEQLQKRQGMQK